jgi:hypothetical protein
LAAYSQTQERASWTKAALFGPPTAIQSTQR